MAYVSIDKTNQAIYTLLHASGALLALAPGDVWDSKSEDGTALPKVVFQRVTGVPDYTMGGGVSSDAQTFMAKAHAEDTDTKTARELCAQIVDLLKSLLNGAALNISGNTTLACYPAHDIPPMLDAAASARSGKDTYQEGFYFDVIGC